MATPASPLGIDRELKAPNLKIGDKVIPSKPWSNFFRKQYLRHLIREKRSVHFLRRGTGRLPEFNKEQIRDCMAVFDQATEFEVAGLAVKDSLNLDDTRFNACYLAGVHGAASPPTYGVQLLIRFERDGNHLAMITGNLDVPTRVLTKIRELDAEEKSDKTA